MPWHILSIKMSSTEACKECHGKLIVQCLLCRDKTPRKSPCPRCEGTGEDLLGSPLTVICIRCDGDGEVDGCARCNYSLHQFGMPECMESGCQEIIQELKWDGNWIARRNTR